MNSFWALSVLVAIMFFWGSISKTNVSLAKFDYLSRFIFEISLVILAVSMVVISLGDVSGKRIERKKKEALLKTLEKQRILLQKKFTVEASTLNFALSPEEEKTDITDDKDLVESENESVILEESKNEEPATVVEATKDSEEQNNYHNQTRPDSLMAEEEAFFDFSPEWQAFLQENEKKSPMEKLNKMLEIN